MLAHASLVTGRLLEGLMPPALFLALFHYDNELRSTYLSAQQFTGNTGVYKMAASLFKSLRVILGTRNELGSETLLNEFIRRTVGNIWTSLIILRRFNCREIFTV